MRYLILTFLIAVTFVNASGQSFSSLADGKKSCWQYLNLTDSFSAKIISYFPNPILSGKFPSASIAIVKLNNGDTIRLVCNRITEVGEGDFIMAYPFKHIDMKNTILPFADDALTCKVPKTTDASLRKLH